jgi:hypothetical protein
MRAEIEKLELFCRHSNQILGSLAAGNQSEYILEQLRNHEAVDCIADRLERRASQGSVDQILWKPSPVSIQPEGRSTASGSSFGETIDTSTFAQFSASESDQPERDDFQFQDPSNWTSVTADSDMVEHLMSLYFSWEYPIFAGLSKRHFLHDFNSGRRRYCSSLLVNAILAVGCRFSDRFSKQGNSDKGETAEDQFHTEAERLWEVEQDSPSLTTIQATGLMSIREASTGKYQKSWYYSGQSIKMAIEMGLHVPFDMMDSSEDDHDVRSITFWGACSLDE